MASCRSRASATPASRAIYASRRAAPTHDAPPFTIAALTPTMPHARQHAEPLPPRHVYE